MVGLGEKWDEVLAVLDDLAAVDVDIVTIGQYLQPSKQHLPIERYYHPDEFAQLAEEGYAPRFQVGGVRRRWCARRITRMGRRGLSRSGKLVDW